MPCPPASLRYATGGGRAVLKIGAVEVGWESVAVRADSMQLQPLARCHVDVFFSIFRRQATLDPKVDRAYVVTWFEASDVYSWKPC